MDVQTLGVLRKEYPTSSWALWSDEFLKEGCIEEDPEELFEFIKQNRDRLRPSIILLSLNPSTSLPSDYLNFHSPEPKHRNDQFRDLVTEADLEGAYMTDLVERIVDPDSGNVEPAEEDVDNLPEQLDILAEDHYYLICFHSKVFTMLKQVFNAKSREYPHNIKGFTTDHSDMQLSCYRVWFHANWGPTRIKSQNFETNSSIFMTISSRKSRMASNGGATKEKSLSNAYNTNFENTVIENAKLSKIISS